MSLEQFEAVVDLAYKMPPFSPNESSREEIVLCRVLRGSGAADSGFLDFATALEAALLSGASAKTELAYRFSLYGALFLRDEYDSVTTFDKLRKVYSVRSKLVHGARVSPESRQPAERDAAELAKAVTCRVVEHGWPDSDALDRIGLGGAAQGPAA